MLPLKLQNGSHRAEILLQLSVNPFGSRHKCLHSIPGIYKQRNIGEEASDY
jgi:hypothetical protein